MRRTDVHLGCYTAESGGAGEGITAVRRDTRTGELVPIGLSVSTPSPSYLGWHPSRPVLYAVNELDEGTLRAWAVDEDGSFAPLGVRPTGGGAPCHLAVAPDGRHVLAANYASGSVALLPLGADGAPGDRSDLVVHTGRGPNAERQEGPHAHFVAAEPEGRVLAVDLGVDAVLAYHLEDGRLVAQGAVARTPPGTGPRHIATGGGRAYVVGELDASLGEYEIGAAGGWRLRETVASTTSSRPAQPSEVAMSSDGRFVHVANRGPDTIATFAVGEDGPRLVAETPTGGTWPRHFVIVDGWFYVANERSHTVTALPIDASTGPPGPVRHVLQTPSPTCVLMPTR